MHKTIRFKIAIVICRMACFLLPGSVFKWELEKTIEKQENRSRLYRKWNLPLREQLIMQAGKNKKRKYKEGTYIKWVKI